MMTEASEEIKASRTTDVVLAEVWRIKDALSASYDHDVHRLFEETREREERSGHPLISLTDLEPKKAEGN